MTEQTPIKTPFFYGWLIVLISGLAVYFSGPGQTYNVSVYIDSYINDFGWSRTTVSSMYSMGTFAAGMLMGVVGKLFDKYGHRKMAVAVAACFGGALFFMSTVNSVTMLLVGFFLIRLLGQGSMGLIGGTLVPQWFIRRKGRALSIVSVFGALSMATFPAMNIWLIQRFGWQNGWRVWMIVLWVIAVPVFYFFIRTRPEDVGLHPDNQRLPEVTDGTYYVIEEEAWTLNEALKTRSFWFVNYITVIPSAIITACMFHQISILGQSGLSPESAALISTVTSLVSLPIVLMAGGLADRYPLKYLMALTQGLLLAVVATLYIADSVTLVLTYGVITGVQMGLQAIVRGVVWPEYFGRKHLSTIRGVNMMAGVIGSSLGPLPFGYAFDVFGGYSEVLLASMVFPLLGIGIGYLANKPVKPQ
ncbi:MAG: MFS transporter [Candidatus Bathyarchaeota archaeon]|nr:MFS transporter [Candidatus Bathyarchaeota archaeon]